MSEYVEATVEIQNLESLRDALVEMGYEVEMGENIYADGYSRKRRKVDLVVRKRSIRAKHKGAHLYGDIGYKKNEDGSITMVVDDMDRSGSLKRIKFEENATYYTGVHNAMKQAKKRGYRVRRAVNEEGEVVLRFKKF